MIDEYANADNFRLEDRAICCTDGSNLRSRQRAVPPSRRTRQRAVDFKTALKLHSVYSARDHYRVCGCVRMGAIAPRPGPGTQWLDEHGTLHEQPRPVNPYKATESAAR